MKYHIYVSDNETAESVKDYFVMSDKPKEEVVKAAALHAIAEYDLSEDDIEQITFDAMPDYYGVIIQCCDYHICVWCNNNNVPTETIPNELFDMAKMIDNNAHINCRDNAEIISNIVTNLHNLSE